MSRISGNSDYVKDGILYWVQNNWKYSYKETPAILKILSRLWSARVPLNFVLNEEKDPDDPLAYLSLEIQPDIEASILLALSGYYRHAKSVLRSWLNLAFASVWFSFNRKQFDLWKKNDPNAPFRYEGVMKRALLNELMEKTAYLRKAESEFTLVENSMSLYEELCDFVHARGRKALDIYLRSDSVPHFYPEHFSSWFDDFRKVFETWIILSFARYPELLQMTRHPQEKEEVLSILSDDRRTKARAR